MNKTNDTLNARCKNESGVDIDIEELMQNVLICTRSF